MHRIILDTDPGIDDALALLLALASPEIQLEAVTTVSGNVPVDQATQNALALLQLAGRISVPVAQGCNRPLIGIPTYATHIHGQHGLGYATLPEPYTTAVAQSGPELIIEKVMEAPGILTLVAIGPLTNIASALQKEPRIAQSVRELVIMGGALYVPGNVTPAAEFNTFVDPYAAHTVFKAEWPIRLVSLDVTRQVRLQREQITQIARNKTPIATCIAHILEFYLGRSRNITSHPMHDPLCLASVFQPELIAWEPLSLDIECEDHQTLGKTRVRERGMTSTNIQASLGVSPEPFIQLFLERLCALSTATAAAKVGAQVEKVADALPVDSF
jgi:inosine-uridine nucleoside N-ribohydrolase